LSLLDIGCGGGLISEPMARLGADVTGIDASEKNIKVARMGVLFYIGENNQMDLENERQWIEMDQRELKDFDYYAKILNEDYPDLIKLKKGINAKTDLLSSEKKSELPKFGAIVKYDYAQTNQRNAQKNPFVNDPYNRNDLRAGVGFTWDMDFGIKKSKQDRLNLEIAELQSKNHFAKSGLNILLQKSYIEVDEAEKKSQALHKAYRSAKKWMSNIGTSVALGLTPPKEIIDAYTTRALVYKDYYESIYKYQMAWAKLSEAVGTEVDPLLKK
jgi:hypothetical protein